MKFEFDNYFRVARNCYYAVTHPMQYGSAATYRDWIHTIEETLNCSEEQAIEIAAADKTNRLHSEHN